MLERSRLDVVEAAARRAATARGLRVQVHSDRELPDLQTQLSLFARAAVVVAPHGAGLIGIIAAAPGTRVVRSVRSRIRLHARTLNPGVPTLVATLVHT